VSNQGLKDFTTFIATESKETSNEIPALAYYKEPKLGIKILLIISVKSYLLHLITLSYYSNKNYTNKFHFKRTDSFIEVYSHLGIESI